MEPFENVLLNNIELDTAAVDIKFKRYINTALIIGPMTMIMAVVGVLRNYGMIGGWVVKCIFTWLTMFPIAYACAFFIIPIANRITNKFTFKGPKE